MTTVANSRKQLTGPAVWQGSELALAKDWRRAWSSAEITEIDAALAAARRRGLSWATLGKHDFKLDAVARLLRQVADSLENGRGLVKLTGFPVADYGPEDLKLIWMGLARHLGTPVYQDSQGQMMREIRNEGGDLAARHGSLESEASGTFLSSKARTYSSGVLRFHTDRCDVVGLLTVGQAKSGGVSKIVSTQALHNAMLERRPDLLEELYRPIHRSRLGEEEGGDKVTYPLPIFGLRDGSFTSHYSRTYVEAAQLLPETPRMTERQWEALDLLQELANELCYEMTLEPGDMQFLNNHVIYHARSAFEDDPASGRVRQLYRVWLSMPNSRPLPQDQAVLWRNVEAGTIRGGIGQEPL